MLPEEGLNRRRHLRVDDASSIPVHGIPDGLLISWRYWARSGAFDDAPSRIALKQSLDVILPGVVVVLIELGEGWGGWGVGVVCGHSEGGREGKGDAEGL